MVKNLKIGVRLSILVMVLCSFMLAVGFIGLRGMQAGDAALRDPDHLHAGGIPGNLRLLAGGDPEIHRGTVDLGFDRRRHRNLVRGDVAEKRPEQLARLVEVTALGGGFEQHPGGQGLELGDAGCGGRKGLFGCHGGEKRDQQQEEPQHWAHPQTYAKQRNSKLPAGPRQRVGAKTGGKPGVEAT